VTVDIIRYNLKDCTFKYYASSDTEIKANNSISTYQMQDERIVWIKNFG
jgi:hypothetical protein